MSDELTASERADLQRLDPDLGNLSGSELAALVRRYPSMFASLAKGIPSPSGVAAARDAADEAAIRAKYYPTMAKK
ncbi:hypothetical protein [Anaeromyxobacter terrae]|uniref:hypothetical protein n=1 Tax=Anaeromyxobacter terrae TaxID=2925406 RepID=UPI001F5A9FE8|nr:hypothetical protein [Anaeromyxobacter sp. SG22]